MKDVIRVSAPEQRDALRSPHRMEILTALAEPTTAADLSERLGMRLGSVYYHLRVLVGAGLVNEVGRRPATKRPERIFQTAARRFEVETHGGDDALTSVEKTMSAAFRMAERELAAALRHEDARTEGPTRNVFATRMHIRVSTDVLAEINEHFAAIEAIVEREGRRDDVPDDADQFCSMTIALLPLGRRGVSKGDPT